LQLCWVHKEWKKGDEAKGGYVENLCGEVKHLHKESPSITEINKKLSPKKDSVIAFSGGEWDSLPNVSSSISGEKLT
jgi:hypothetical protein